MITTVSRWGNSLALRIPAPLARALAVADGGRVEISVQGDSLLVTPLETPAHFDLADLVSAITDDNRHAAIGTGSAVGDEFR